MAYALEQCGRARAGVKPDAPLRQARECALRAQKRGFQRNARALCCDLRGMLLAQHLLSSPDPTRARQFWFATGPSGKSFLVARIWDTDCNGAGHPSLFQTSSAPCSTHQPGRQHENTWRRVQIACRARTLGRRCSSQHSAAERSLTVSVYGCAFGAGVSTRDRCWTSRINCSPSS